MKTPMVLPVGGYILNPMGDPGKTRLIHSRGKTREFQVAF